jgi:hypothetical protein
MANQVGYDQQTVRKSRAARPWLLALAVLPVAVPDLSAAPPRPAAHLAAPASAGTPKFAELRDGGRRAYQAERFDEALQLWSAAAALKPDDVETVADLALAFQHLRMTDEAIKANRDAIRLASSARGGGDRARRIRRAAYYNLGKLKAVRAIQFIDDSDGPSSCVRLESEPGCPRPVFACGRTGATGGRDGGWDYTAARFALDRETARIVEDNEFVAAFDSWVPFGDDQETTHDRSDAPSYDVTLELSSETREPMPGEADVPVVRENSGCAVVHVDACARRLGLYCEWTSWERGVTAKPRARAVELTFARAATPAR